jgi:membrane fusion protein (multidrug efflux system)
METDMRRAICLLVAACALALPVQAQTPAPAPPPAVPVGTVTAERQPVTPTKEYVGRVDAINRVEIRARVTGYLDDVQFKDGQLVKAGQPLYSIEKGLFDADVKQAEGALARSTASHTLAVLQRQRAEEMYRKEVGTAVARDQTVAAQQSAAGQMTTDQGNLLTAQINLGYTEITSPIDGRIGRTNVTKGNVVGPDSGPLTMIVSQDPMYVSFPVSQREFLATEAASRRVDTIKVNLRFADGSTYDQTGVIDFINVSVDRATDTVLVRATIANPSNTLIDGQFVQVVLSTDKPQEMLVVPSSALIADQEGIYLFIVADGKAAIRRVKPGFAVGTNTVIQEGLSGGEQVIVEGLQAVRPGVPVQASPLPRVLGQG